MAVEHARSRGITLITLPPHTTHKMQPLDRAYFKCIKSAYNAAADSWMVANPGRTITAHDMAALIGKAFLRSDTPVKAVAGFRACGIWSFDAEIFTDEDYVSAAVTEEDVLPQIAGPPSTLPPTAGPPSALSSTAGPPSALSPTAGPPSALSSTAGPPSALSSTAGPPSALSSTAGSPSALPLTAGPS